MTEFTDQELGNLKEISQRLASLRDYLSHIDLNYTSDPVILFRQLGRVKEIQGNSSNDLSLVACLLAKRYLAARYDIGDYDATAKPQGAPGLDIDLWTRNGLRLIGEIKTTTPYSEAKGDLGAQQKMSFQKDFDKLNHTNADRKFFFVTSAQTLGIVERKYAQKLPGVSIVLLDGNLALDVT